MIGRLAVRQPWIFSRTKKLAAGKSSPAGECMECDLPVNLPETGLRFLDFLSRYQPQEFYLSRARLFFAYFCDNLKWGNYLKNLINREQDLQGIEKVWKTFFSEHHEPREALKTPVGF